MEMNMCSLFDGNADLTVAIFGRRLEFFGLLNPRQRPKKAK
jgi:hypothetical protein